MLVCLYRCVNLWYVLTCLFKILQLMQLKFQTQKKKKLFYCSNNTCAHWRINFPVGLVLIRESFSLFGVLPIGQRRVDRTLEGKAALLYYQLPGTEALR